MKASWNAQVVAQNPVVLEAQRILVQLGYNVGRPDGMIGPRTVAAVREFEAKNGFAQTGQVTEALVARLAFVQQ